MTVESSKEKQTVGRRRRRITLAVVSGVLAVALAPLAVAWACTPEATISVSTSQGPAGTPVTVSGASFAGGPVEISVNGRAVGSASGASFATPVTIPTLAPGIYYVVAIGRDGAGQIAGRASAAFEVTVAPGAGGGSNGAGDAAGRRGSDESAGRSRRSRRPRAGHWANRGEGSRAVANGRAGVPAGGASDPPVVGSPSGQPVFAGSLAPEGDDAAGPAASRSRAGRSTSSERSAASDLWSAFDGARSAALRAGLSSQTPSSAPGSQLTVVMGLLGLGLVALLSGLAVVGAARRRRARART